MVILSGQVRKNTTVWSSCLVGKGSHLKNQWYGGSVLLDTARHKAI